ncbi:MAG: UbiX family flavin prenyltransferase [Thermoplasmatales archaeon]|nr:UbiX family flavin prenyltransferase [Thermoplasmatales archaeon]
MRTVVAITGASGIAYGIKFLENLPGERVLVVSEMAKKILPRETGIALEELYAMADEVYSDDDLFAPISSGSHRFDAMIVIPCSASSLGKIACGLADTLITRAAAVALKESRKLVLVVRETPKSAVLLENELRLARAGAVILDANPGFYHKPKTVDDVVSFVAGRALDQLGVEHALYEKWS